MNLLFVTRKIDRHDSRTGFVFDWLRELASALDKLYVICQEKGDTSGLPDNIEIHSLGKEQGKDKFFQGYKLLVTSYQLGRKADGFFVHMMPVYAIISGLASKLLGKKMIFWYTHKSVDWKLRLAEKFADEIFTASPESFRLPSKKVRIVGHGINLAKFTPSLLQREDGGEFKIISVGRISPVKDYETLLKAIELLVNHNNITDIRLDIYGAPAKAEDRAYLQDLQEFVKHSHLQDYISFRGAVPHEKTPEIYREADLLVNLSETGSIDKNVLEAAASACLALSCNEAFTEKFSTISPHLIFERNQPQELMQKIETLKNLSPSDRAALSSILRTWVAKEHNLKTFAQKILAAFR